MKSATAHDPGVHGVHDSPASAPAVYSSRIRKPKRRPMASAPSSARGRTRAADLKDKDRSARPTPSPDAPDLDAPKPPSPAPHPASAPPTPADNNHSNKSPDPHNSPDAKSNHKKNDKADKKKKDTTPPPAVPLSLPVPSPSTKSTVWTMDEILALAKQAVVEKTTDSANLFPGSTSKLADIIPTKSQAGVSSVIDHFKAPFGTTTLPFAPKCGVSEFTAALASQHSFVTQQKTALDAATAKHTKVLAERKRVEKSIEKLKREVKSFKDEIDKEKQARDAAIVERDAAEVRLEANKRKQEKERETQAARRDDLVKAKFSELDMRRRLDRMRLKVAALRGEMVTPTVDHLFRQGCTSYGGLHEDIVAVENDPLVVIREGVPMKGVPMKRNSVDTGSDDANAGDEEAGEDMEVDAGNGVQAEEWDLDEDAEETQLRLLRNRLAMCETEAEEWADSLESAQGTVRLVTIAKARLDEEMTRLKQPSNHRAGGSGRVVGKGGSQNARNAAKLRAAARAALVPVAELGAKKTVKKSRKGRPRRSLVPYYP